METSRSCSTPGIEKWHYAAKYEGVRKFSLASTLQLVLPAGKAIRIRIHIDRSKEQASYASVQVYLTHKFIPKAKTHGEAIYAFKKKERKYHFTFNSLLIKLYQKSNRAQPIQCVAWLSDSAEITHCWLTFYLWLIINDGLQDNADTKIILCMSVHLFTISPFPLSPPAVQMDLS